MTLPGAEELRTGALILGTRSTSGAFPCGPYQPPTIRPSDRPRKDRPYTGKRPPPKAPVPRPRARRNGLFCSSANSCLSNFQEKASLFDNIQGGENAITASAGRLLSAQAEMRKSPDRGCLSTPGGSSGQGTQAFRTKNSAFSRFRGRQQFHVAKIDPSRLLRPGNDLEPEGVVHEAFLRNPHHRSRFEALNDGGRPFRALSYP